MAKVKNPFNPEEVDFTLPRNPYDWSNNELFSVPWGQLTPIRCYEVVPGMSVKIHKASVGVRAMPTAFPIQTPIKGRLSWFYVRNRTLYKDFEDFIFKTKEGLVSPYLDLDQNRYNIMMRTGGLFDCLGGCTTTGSVSLNYSNLGSGIYTASSWLAPQFGLISGGSANTLDSLLHSLNTNFGLTVNYYNVTSSNANGKIWFSDVRSDVVPSSLFISNLPDSITSSYPVIIGVERNVAFLEVRPGQYQYAEPGRYYHPDIRYAVVNPVLRDGTLSYGLTSDLKNFISGSTNWRIYVFSNNAHTSVFPIVDSSSYVDWRTTQITYNVTDIHDVPYADSKFNIHRVHPLDDPVELVSSLPFRAYEMICNYFYRNDLNNPYVLDGQVEYNKFIPTDEGGPDANLYDFHFHNFELDAFTSALQSPQFGAAPLVGLSYRVAGANDGYWDVATLKFQDAEDESKSYTAQVAVDPETGKLAQVVNFDRNIPAANLQQVTQLVDAGFSINTIRDVNSFVRFKENALRRGLRYRNQLKSHMGVDVDYPDIDVPQYIGGYSAYLNVGQVTNVSDTGSVGLGDYIGTLSGLIDMQNVIQCYCPEHGFIIGIFSICPTPAYPQSVEKYLIKTNPFDYYQAEFGKIGYVPIHYAEVAPNQSSNVDAIFGYQRAWYDYMQRRDNVHGDFRTSLNGFTLARNFVNAPVLSRAFTQVNPDDFNHVFLNQNIATEYNSSAKFLLSTSVNCTVLSPVPRHGTPSLE